MPRLLILNHHGPSVPHLLDRVRETSATFELVEPEEVGRSSMGRFAGVIASGGFLPAASFREDLERYSGFLDSLTLPFLGVCLGMKILGHYYGARMRRITPAAGTRPLHFLRDYPLAPGVRECSVYQSHRYELLSPLPSKMQNYATDGGSIQAVKITGEERYGLQFHPELSEMPARSMIANFVSLC